MPSVAEELKRERELRGIGLREISEETKIGLRFLEAIDSDRMDLIPGEFYRLAYVRAYARYIGIDADRVVATYRFRAAARAPKPNPESEAAKAHGVLGFGRVSATKWSALVLVGVGLSGAAVVVWPGGGAERLLVPVPPPPQSVAFANTQPASAPPQEPVVREEIERERAVGLPLRLLVQVDEPCWLEVRADEEVATQGLMLRGFQKEFGARDEIRLWLGNAGGVSLWINGSPAKPLGRPGQVRKDVRITMENYTDFLLSEPGPAAPGSRSNGTGR